MATDAQGRTLTKNGKVMGRPPGSPNKTQHDIKRLCEQFTPAAVEELARIAGVHREPVVDRDGNPILIPQFNPDGSPALGSDGKQLVGARMRRVGGSGSDQARIAAITALWDRAYGKARQPVTGEEGHPPVNPPTGQIELEVVAPGTPLADNANDFVSEDDAPAAPANDVEPKVA